MSVMVLIITCNRPALLRKCLDSVLASLRLTPHLQARIRIGLAQATHETVQLVEHYKKQNQIIETYVMREKFLPGEARNRGLFAFPEEWIYFIDDDAYVEPDFFPCAETHFQNPNLMAFGGPNITPPSSNAISHLSQLAFQSPFGAGGVFKRYATHPRGASRCDESSLILCNLFVHRKVLDLFPDSRLFDPKLPCAEENHSLWQLSHKGHFLLSDPKLWVWHYRRSDLPGLIRQLQKYGEGRGLLMGLYQECHWFHLVPCTSLFAFVTLIGFRAWSVTAAVMCFYGFLLLFFAAHAAWREKKISNLKVIGLFPLIHFFYALGTVRGLVKAILHRLGTKPLPLEFPASAQTRAE